MKDYSNFIINPSDSRYGKLGHLMNKYDIFKGENFGNLVYKNHDNSYCYFIPHELVINEYATAKTWVTTKVEDHISDYWKQVANWVSAGIFKRVIKYSCEITDQEYFDLFQLKINSKLNRPRCSNFRCKIPMEFINVLRGYGSSGRLWTEVDGVQCCCRSCATEFQMNSKLYTPFGFRDWKTLAKTHAKWFINQGNNEDECYFYITVSENKFKFGITYNLDYRTHTYHSFNSEDNELHVIYISDRVSVAKLEYQVKIEMDNEGLEYLEFNNSMFNFRTAYIKALSKLNNNEIEL